MKRTVLAVLPLVAVIATACSSSAPPKETPAPAASEAPKPPVMTPEEELAKINTVRALSGLPPLEKEEQTAPQEEWLIFKDEQTGRMLQRIPKGPTLRAENGKLRHTLLNPAMFTLDLVREDDSFYYVDAPKEPATPAAAPPSEETFPEGLTVLQEVPASEYEVVAPPPSKVRLRLEEKSEGLPITGFWRSNMTVADLDGDGSPEIVTPPPRLSGATFRVFRFDGGRWVLVEPRLEGGEEERLRFGYGGVDVADMDGDGRLDVLGVGHGYGPVVAFNLGDFRFRLEARGLPRKMSGRAIAAGDVDGDGLMDIVAVSDEPEGSRKRQREERAAAYAQVTGEKPAEDPGADGYAEGLDARAFFGVKGGGFSERSKGLENACFGYSLELAASPSDGGNPYHVSGCRYQGGRALLYEYDRSAREFRHVGRGVVEEYSFHSGAAVGTFRGLPAAFTTWVKGNAPGTDKKPIRGHGVSIYYREGGAWKSKRLVKVLADIGDEAAGIAAGDLNGDGLDDVAWADDSVGRVRVFFQTKAGEFEELDAALQPKYVNHSMSMAIVDVDRDGRKDIVLMYEYRTTDKTRAGGVRFFRNAG